MRAFLLLLTAILIFGLAAWFDKRELRRRPPEPVTRPEPEAAGLPPADAPADVPAWAGSETCRSCHPGIYKRWKGTGRLATGWGRAAQRCALSSAQ